MTTPHDQEAFDAFLEEAKENLASLEQRLLDLERSAPEADPELVNTLFRSAHTLKGTAGFFGLMPFTNLSHAIEDVLGLVRSDDLVCERDVVAAMISASDLLGTMLGDLSKLDEIDPSQAIGRLQRIAVAAGLPAQDLGPGGPGVEALTQPAPAPLGPEARAEEPAAEPAALAQPEAAQEQEQQEHEQERDQGLEDTREPAEPLHAKAQQKAINGAAAKGKSEGAGSIRVNLGQLDRLMMLAGELVLTRNALLKKAAERDLDGMLSLTERVDAVTSDLQDGVMATRMQPVGLVFNRFRRVVRDLAAPLGKEIELEVEGEEVELDRTLIEAIGDPLTHLVRNSADHGIELPEKRLAAGKPKAGKLTLRAVHEAGQVVIQVADDGGGIDPDKVSAVALKKGLYTAEQLRAMSRDDKIRLIFAPGFSTADKVTDISGRGVGMDVVLSSLTKVGGTVDIQSAVGKGTTVSVRLPLTLAIIPSVLVTVNEEVYAIPQVNLVELVRVPGAEVQKRIERVGSAAVMRLRGELLPLVRLSDVLGLEPRFRDPSSGELLPDRRGEIADRRARDLAAPEESAAQRQAEQDLRTGQDRRSGRSRAVNVVVVAHGNFRYGIIVHQFLDSEEIVVKPLGRHLAGNREYAGATILGDGAVALILDVAGVSAVANLASTKSTIDSVEARRRESALARDAQTMLVVENGPGEFFALPLGLVSRIERIRQDQVTLAGGRRTVTYDQKILPLLAIEGVAKVSPRVEAPRFFGIVCRQGGREYGVLASRVVDVVDSLAPIDSATHAQPGILGSMVIDGQVVLLLDLHSIVSTLLPEYRPEQSHAAAKVVEPEQPPLILVVEDSPFFRKQVVSCLQEAGYETISAGDGEEGLSALAQNHERVKLVITDIEMPKLDGLSMTRRIRGDRHNSWLPILAVTSLSGEAAERMGREAGLTEFLVKLDREQILERTHFYLHTSRSGPRAEA